MSEITENQIEKILDRLMKSDLTAYYIAKKTGISEQTILNYRSKKTYPTESNAKLLEYFLMTNLSILARKIPKIM